MLYFDIDGTLLDSSVPKPLLADGAFERLVRAAKFERLVCVGNVGLIIQALERAGIPQDGLATVWRSCRGCFADEEWFRSVTTLVEDADDRVAYVDTTLDWYLIDDLAERYSEKAGKKALYDEHLGARIFVPVQTGDGADVVAWLGWVQGI
jgi:hypothetical protein